MVARADVLVVGGGPAGHGGGDRGAARNGCSVTLLERYNLSRRPGLGRHGAGARRHVGQRLQEISVTRPLHGDDRAHGQASALARLSAARRNAGSRCASSTAAGRAGAAFDFRSAGEAAADRASPPRSIPDGWKRVSNEMVAEHGVEPAAALVVLRRALVRRRLHHRCHL